LSLLNLRNVVAVTAAVLCAAGSSLAQERTTIIAGKALMPDGKLVENMGIVFFNGKIEKVAPASELPAPDKGTYIKLDKAVLSPGLIDLGSALGAWGSNIERVKSVDPQLSAQDAIDPGDAGLSRAMRSGITAIMVVPDEANVVCGTAATVRTWSANGQLDIIRGDGPMIFSLGPAVWNADREPTSRPGSLNLLRAALSDAKVGKGDARLAQVVQKKLGAIVTCSAQEDVDGALRTFGEFGVTPHIEHNADAVQVAEDIAGDDAVLAIVGPYRFDSTQRVLTGAAAYAKAGVEIAFSAQTPLIEATGLRATAALAVRYGLDSDAARRGLTANAAKIAGVGDKVGSLKSGLDADLVLFSGDPLRLDSKVLAVYVKGVQVYSAANEREEGVSHDADLR